MQQFSQLVEKILEKISKESSNSGTYKKNDFFPEKLEVFLTTAKM